MIREKNKVSLKKMLSEGQVFAPCVWDPISARAAEVSGFKAVLLAGGPIAAYANGLPDIGLITADDLVRQTERVCDYTSLPVIVDADDGYGETPLNTFRLAKRLVRAGAAGFSIEDSTGFRGFNRWAYFTRTNRPDGSVEHPIVSKELWLSKIAAALDACNGTDCLVIARTEAKFGMSLDVAIDRALAARELGADIVLVMGMLTIEEAKKVSDCIPGWKMWPDVQSKNGVPDVRLDEIAPLGFNLVTTHIFERGCFSTMVNVGRHVLEEESTVFADTFPLATDKKTAVQAFETRLDDPWLLKEDEWLSIAKKHC